MIAAGSSILPALVNAIGWALVHFLWQGVLIGCGLAFLLTFMRNARPQARYALACAALLLCVITPLIEVFARLKNTNLSTQVFNAANKAMASSIQSSELLPLTGWLQNHIETIVLFWLSTVLLLSLRLGLGLFWLNGYHDARRSSSRRTLAAATHTAGASI